MFSLLKIQREDKKPIDTTSTKIDKDYSNIRRKKRHSYPIQSVLSQYMKLQSPPAKLKSQFQLPRTKSLPIGISCKIISSD